MARFKIPDDVFTLTTLTRPSLPGNTKNTSHRQVQGLGVRIIQKKELILPQVRVLYTPPSTSLKIIEFCDYGTSVIQSEEGKRSKGLEGTILSRGSFLTSDLQVQEPQKSDQVKPFALLRAIEFQNEFRGYLFQQYGC
ncbi:hypothetical protein TNIN_494941 [Trichonephila inaurata madagascariensis]|uniref:Uncharacterized protein n=1 Tax=Trichonephila inaurata madagascariensis TaxID=2747483 RepID=A0A8X7BRR0_9ARAC|nr:hypothetical protein TNIN_494941 [Trichonephila inaurata madagascariensis]